MTEGSGWAELVDALATNALRAGTRADLEAAFDAWLAGEIDDAAGRGRYGWDPREAMMDLAPFVDCARRLDLDPVAVLGARADEVVAAGAVPEPLAAVIHSFLRRTDVTPEVFGWSVVELDGGPAYRFRWPF